MSKKDVWGPLAKEVATSVAVSTLFPPAIFGLPVSIASAVGKTIHNWRIDKDRKTLDSDTVTLKDLATEAKYKYENSYEGSDPNKTQADYEHKKKILAQLSDLAQTLDSPPPNDAGDAQKKAYIQKADELNELLKQNDRHHNLWRVLKQSAIHAVFSRNEMIQNKANTFRKSLLTDIASVKDIPINNDSCEINRSGGYMTIMPGSASYNILSLRNEFPDIIGESSEGKFIEIKNKVPLDKLYSAITQNFPGCVGGGIFSNKELVVHATRNKTGEVIHIDVDFKNPKAAKAYLKFLQDMNTVEATLKNSTHRVEVDDNQPNTP